MPKVVGLSTSQQWEIARLVATDLTKQIGEKLLLSPRTVSTHLYRLFPKLAVMFRAARMTGPVPGPRAVKDRAAPRIDRVRRRDLQHPAPQHRVVLGPADQCGEHLQPVPSRSGILLQQQRRRRHLASPQTVRKAASKTGPWTSTCP
ncbi:response regulator transcription factor [Streptomyces mirabilis]|uniref:response regulator transcription factor n=1 Tax=Streptomyces mirabilis TaxID=68239 RepID=UPI0036DC0254